MLVVQPIEPLLEVQEQLVNPEAAYWDTVTAKDLLRSGTVTDGDLEHSARNYHQPVSTLPMQKYQMQSRFCPL